MIVIAVDAMGGDNAPEAIVQGCGLALAVQPQARILLFGPEARLAPLVQALPAHAERIELRDAPDVITNHDAPVLAIRKKTQSSIVRAYDALRAGEAQAFVSAGSTGAVLAGGMFRLGRIRGIERPALAPLLPSRKNPVLLIDCGANVDCKPEYLAQFGLMGSAYMQNVQGIDSPGVGLVNIGDEPEKGNELIKQTFPLMQKQPYRFAGNIEARDIPKGDMDVIVCDGFSGNLILKFMEGLAGALMGMLKDEIMATPVGKLGGAMLKPTFSRFRKRMDYEEYGGAPLLGVDGAVVKAHGSSGAYAFSNAVLQAARMVERDVVGSIRKGLEQLSNANGDGGSV